MKKMGVMKKGGKGTGKKKGVVKKRGGMNTKKKMKMGMGKKTEMRNMEKGMKVENFKDMMFKKFGGKL